MIELYDGQITDLLRNNPLQYDPEVMAMGYAIREEKRRIMAETAQTLTMAMLDNAPEFVLDVLAVELRTPAYDETLPVETKRTLIKGTLEFYAHLGTPWAVNWVIRSIFGNGKVTDWYEYGGEAHHFRVSAMCMNTSNTNSGGWKNSHMMKTICPAFLNALPSAWRNAIKNCTKYSDNTGGGNDTASYVTATTQKIFLLAEFEGHGTRYYANSAEKNYQRPSWTPSLKPPSTS